MTRCLSFNGAVTFYVPDSVIHVGGDDDISHVYDSLIIAQDSRQHGRGRVTRESTLTRSTADLTLNPAVDCPDNYDYTGR